MQKELTSTGNRIGFARQLYNGFVRQFNTRQTLFPTLIIASLLGFRQAEYFQAEAGPLGLAYQAMTDIYSRQRRNRRAALALMLGFFLLPHSSASPLTSIPTVR